MAKIGGIPATAFLFLAAVVSIAAAARYSLDAGGQIVGGITPVKDVKKDKVVQDLGRFSVEEHNRIRNTAEEKLRFVKVVEAEKQVVSGLKYYLKISTLLKGGEQQMFRAVVVVKPWMKKKPKELLGFDPISH